MSFEQPIYSFNHSNGEPPTPTRTPTSPNFFLNSFETPKPDNRFNDPLSPWTPSFGLSPAFKTPAQALFQSPGDDLLQKALSVSEDAQAKIASSGLKPTSHLNQSSSPPPSVQSPSTGRPPEDFQKPSPSTTGGKEGQRETQGGAQLDREAESEAAISMQTPPPTSTSTSRRRAQEIQLARSMNTSVSTMNQTQSSSSFSQALAAQAPSTQVEDPPLNFPHLQFSPDGLGFANSGPATAPVYPQQKLFWDPDQNVNAMGLDLPMDDSFTGFGLGVQRQLDPFVSEHETLLHQQQSSMANLNTTGLHDVSMAELSVPRHSVALNQTNVSPSTAIMTQGSSRGRFGGVVINPSMLFSSPNRPSTSSGQKIQADTLKPYAHQLHDAEIERELRSRRPKRKRGAEVESPAVQAATLALREAEEEGSQTSSDSAVTPSFGGPMPSRAGHARTSQRGSRRSSNMEEPRIGSNGHILLSQRQGKRASITLSIDASGRASTQTKFVQDPTNATTTTAMDVDSDSSSSDSSSSPSSGEMVFSQPSSFAYPVDRKKKAKSNHLYPRSTSHSQKSSYGSMVGAMTSISGLGRSDHGIDRLNDRQRSSLQDNQNYKTHVQFTKPESFVQGQLQGSESEAETIVETDEDNGNAQAELKKVLLRRSSQKSKSKPQTLPSQQRKSGSGHTLSGPPPLATLFYSQMNSTPRNLGYSETNKNISPTTITDPDLVTPSTGPHSATSNGSTRCVCNATEGDGKLMVQCESCQKWLHTKCVGLNEHNLPAVYLCIFCTGPTPNARGGRVREPARAVFPVPASPLAYKSNRER